jgi:hypothetical protein
MATKAKGKTTTKAASKPAKKVPAIPPGYGNRPARYTPGEGPSWPRACSV